MTIGMANTIDSAFGIDGNLTRIRSASETMRSFNIENTCKPSECRKALTKISSWLFAIQDSINARKSESSSGDVGYRATFLAVNVMYLTKGSDVAVSLIERFNMIMLLGCVEVE